MLFTSPPCSGQRVESIFAWPLLAVEQQTGVGSPPVVNEVLQRRLSAGGSPPQPAAAGARDASIRHPGRPTPAPASYAVRGMNPKELFGETYGVMWNARRSAKAWASMARRSSLFWRGKQETGMRRRSSTPAGRATAHADSRSDFPFRMAALQGRFKTVQPLIWRI